MHIATVKGSALVAALQKVIKVRQNNAILPALEAVHCKAIKGGLILTCTNLDTSIQTGIKVDAKEVGKEFLIPIRAQSVLLALKDAESIEIHNGDNLTFKYGDNKFTVPCDDIEGFPINPTPEIDVKFKIEDSTTFHRTLETLKKFTATDDLRPTMTGIHFTNTGLAATDGHRLMTTAYESCDEAFETVISKTFINALSALEGAINVHIGKTHTVAYDKGTKIISRKIDGQFPQVRAVIPKESAVKVKVKRLELLKNIKLALNMTEKNTKRLVLSFNDKAYKLSAQDNELTQEIVLNGEAEFKKNKNAVEQFEMCYNGAFLQNQLDLMVDENVTFECNDAEKATVFNEGENKFLLMPVKK